MIIVYLQIIVKIMSRKTGGINHTIAMVMVEIYYLIADFYIYSILNISLLKIISWLNIRIFDEVKFHFLSYIGWAIHFAFEKFFFTFYTTLTILCRRHLKCNLTFVDRISSLVFHHLKE